MAPDPRITAFVALVEAHDLHGLAFQHLALCERRAWLHLSRIDYAHLDHDMALGTAAHDVARPRDRSVEGLFGLSPDRIDWESGVVVEAKNGSRAVEAVSRQTAFYALVLAGATGRQWRARNDLLAARRRRDVPVDDAMIDALLADAHRLAELSQRETAPEAERKPICTRCSYRHLCGVA